MYYTEYFGVAILTTLALFGLLGLATAVVAMAKWRWARITATVTFVATVSVATVCTWLAIGASHSSLSERVYETRRSYDCQSSYLKEEIRRLEEQVRQANRDLKEVAGRRDAQNEDLWIQIDKLKDELGSLRVKISSK